MARRYKCPYKVLPEHTGGLTTYQAQKLIQETLEELAKKVDVGPWVLGVDTHKELGTIEVKLTLSLWKKGWSPPEEAIAAFKAKTEKQRRAKAPEPEIRSSTKSPKKAR